MRLTKVRRRAAPLPPAPVKKERRRRKGRLGETRNINGRLHRQQLHQQPDGRLWCVACCAAAPAPHTDDTNLWCCPRGHTYWYADGYIAD